MKILVIGGTRYFGINMAVRTKTCSNNSNKRQNTRFIWRQSRAHYHSKDK